MLYNKGFFLLECGYKIKNTVHGMFFVWLESADLEIHQWVTGTLIGVFTWHTLVTTSKKLIARLAWCYYLLTEILLYINTSFFYWSTKYFQNNSLSNIDLYWWYKSDIPHKWLKCKIYNETCVYRTLNNLNFKEKS